MKYNLKEFQADFPDDAACLDFVFRTRYPDGGKCECGKSACFHRLAGRRAYSCAWCGFQLYPTAGTIFHKSETPIRLWFFAIFLFSQSKNGVAAKELERQLGVTYKTAHRMGHKIRALMHGGKDMLAGVCEADETYVGGKRRGKRGRGAEGKTPVVGVAMRRGGVKAKVIAKVEAQTLIPFVRESVQPGAAIVTDELPAYNYVGGFGFKHDTINHAAGLFVSGRVHTQTIDGFWSQLKRSIDGTHHSVSRKYLQSYVDEFAFRYSNRFEDVSIFDLMTARVGEQLSEVTGKT